MDYEYNETLDRIGRIDEDGTVYDTSGNSMAKIHDSGYIFKLSGDGSASIFGRIDKDGTIRNPGGDVVGRIDANGYIYIQSRIVGRSANFRNTQPPKGGDKTEQSTVSNRERPSGNSSGSESFSFPPNMIKIKAPSIIVAALVLFQFSFMTKGAINSPVALLFILLLLGTAVTAAINQYQLAFLADLACIATLVLFISIDGFDGTYAMLVIAEILILFITYTQRKQ